MLHTGSTHGDVVVEDVDALQAVGGEAGGGVLPLPQVQAGGDVGRHRQAERDDQRILDEVRLGIGKGRTGHRGHR